MKKIILRIAFLSLFCFWGINITFSQPFTNFNSSQFCGSLYGNYAPGSSISQEEFDPFYINNYKCLLPWEVSHGTPQLYLTEGINSNKKGIYLFSGDDSDAPQGAGQGKVSEGVFYKYNFKKNQRYRLKGTVQGYADNSTDKFTIALVNNLQTVTTTSSWVTSSNNRSYLRPNVSSKQDIYTLSNITVFDKINFDIVFYPDQDYNCIWMYPEDDEKIIYFSNGKAGEAEIVVSNLEIPCDAAASTDLVINSTESLLGTSYNLHKPLAPIIQANNILVPCTGSPVRISKTADLPVHNNTYTYQPDPPVIMEAATSICIMSTPNASNSSYFEVELGRVFEARINPTPCFKNNCGGFIAWDDHRIVKPLTWLNTSNDNIFPVWSIQSLSYPIPFNAYKYKLEIFASNGNRIYSKSFEDRENGLSDEIIKVFKSELLGNTLPTNVATFYLLLENCNGTRLITGDISPTTGNTWELTTSKKDDKNGMLFPNKSEINQEYGQPNVRDFEFKISPNPLNKDCLLSFILPDEANVNLWIYNQIGQVVETRKLGSFLSGEYQKSISFDNLPNGLYIFTLKTSSGKILSKKISKTN